MGVIGGRLRCCGGMGTYLSVLFFPMFCFGSGYGASTEHSARMDLTEIPTYLLTYAVKGGLLLDGVFGLGKRLHQRSFCVELVV